MKKLVVMSDNHGDYGVMDYIKNLENDADLYIHLGDSEAIDESILEGWIAVSGNNDWDIDLPNALILSVEDLKILCTHGQNFGYFNRNDRIMNLLKKNECQVMLSGHTHMPNFEQEGNYTFINPGSTSWPRGGSVPSYAVIIVDGKHVNCDFKTL